LRRDKRPAERVVQRRDHAGAMDRDRVIPNIMARRDIALTNQTQIIDFQIK
jgi:hypothetical protein